MRWRIFQLALICAWFLNLHSAQAQGEKQVTIELKEAPVADAFDQLFRAAGENFILMPGVPREQRLTMRLADVPFEKALNFLCDLAGLKWERKDGVFVISPRQPMIGYGMMGGPAFPPHEFLGGMAIMGGAVPLHIPPGAALSPLPPVFPPVRIYAATPMSCPRCKTPIRRECPRCKELMAWEWRFCPFDGTKLAPPPEKCPNCGAPLPNLPKPVIEQPRKTQ